MRERQFAKRLGKYGLTEGDIPDSCEICGQEESATRGGKLRRLCMDHFHETGAFRGFLCARCNAAVGLLDDDVTIARKLVEYLEYNRAYIDLQV